MLFAVLYTRPNHFILWILSTSTIVFLIVSSYVDVSDSVKPWDSYYWLGPSHFQNIQLIRSSFAVRTRVSNAYSGTGRISARKSALFRSLTKAVARKIFRLLRYVVKNYFLVFLCPIPVGKRFTSERKSPIKIISSPAKLDISLRRVENSRNL